METKSFLNAFALSLVWLLLCLPGLWRTASRRYVLWGALVVFGLPLALFGLMRAGHAELAGLLPVGLCHIPASVGVNAGWFGGMLITSGFTAWLIHNGLKHADRDLRKWYDANQGTVAN